MIISGGKLNQSYGCVCGVNKWKDGVIICFPFSSSLSLSLSLSLPLTLLMWGPKGLAYVNPFSFLTHSENLSYSKKNFKKLLNCKLHNIFTWHIISETSLTQRAKPHTKSAKLRTNSIWLNTFCKTLHTTIRHWTVVPLFKALAFKMQDIYRFQRRILVVMLMICCDKAQTGSGHTVSFYVPNQKGQFVILTYNKILCMGCFNTEHFVFWYRNAL